MLKPSTCRTCLGTRQVTVKAADGKEIVKVCPMCCPQGQIAKAGGYVTK